MVAKPFKFKRKLLASSISTCLLASAGAVMAQEAVVEEEVLVRGIRASIETSINTKRNADTVVEAITAEDIGKLPDVTIADSLQRISGVQIRRSAGEGSAINIRGLPQVVSQLNGEQFIGAQSVVSTQPDFSDIPSQLFKGADVYKSATADLGSTGITGTVNLKTYRPFDFDDGFTSMVAVEAQRGSETGETDPVISGLANFKGDRFGFMLAANIANVNLSNSYNGINVGSPSGDDVGWTGRSTDANVIANIGGDALADLGATSLTDQGRSFLSLQGISAWNQVTERERTGLNGSLQVDLGEGFTLTTDYFYAGQDEYNRMIGVSATNKWQNWDWLYPTASRDVGKEVDGNDFHVWTVAELSPKRLKSFTQNESYHRTSRNLNIQLDYDNGGAFTGQFRVVSGDAIEEKRHGYNEGDLTNGASTLGRTTNFLPADACRPGDDFVGDDGGCWQEINPLGYSENPHITWNTNGEHPTWSGFDRELAGGLGAGATTADYMANVDSYNVGAFSSENNENANGTLDAFSLKGNYAFDDGFVTSVDMGLRLSARDADFERYNLFSPFHNAGCEAQWKATDVILNSTAPAACFDGEEIAGEFEPYVVLRNVPLDEFNNVKWVTDFGPVNGIPGVWAVDPADYDDPKAFHDRVFGSTTKAVVPGSTFKVSMDELSYFAQLNFEAGPVSGNFGVKRIETELSVQQNQAGGGIPYGNTNYDVGDILTVREYADDLFSLNAAWDVAEDVIVRFAYSQAMVPLDLNQYGDGLTLNTTIDSDPTSPTFNQFIVSGGSLNGNPALNPWRSDSVDLSVEWYMASTSMLSAGVFKVDIDSFTQAESVQMFQPDADGVIRRQVNIDTTTQGEGGTLEGFELNAKIAFSDFMDDGFVADLGIDANYTHSPSDGSGEDFYGNQTIFPDNSEDQYNFSVWYESDRFQARVAYNYRSERLVATGAAWGELDLYQAETAYVDLSATYDITDEISVFVYGSNITGEFEEYYLEFPDQLAWQNYYEPRYTLGVRARF